MGLLRFGALAGWIDAGWTREEGAATDELGSQLEYGPSLKLESIRVMVIFRLSVRAERRFRLAARGSAYRLFFSQR
jgi:hypothetical protein